MSLYKKVFIAFALIGIVPLIIYTVLSTVVVLDEIQDHNRSISLEELQNIDTQVSTLLETAENEVMTLSENMLLQYESDDDFTNFIGADEETFEYDITEEEQNIIDLFATYKLNHSYMNSVYYGTVNGAFVRSHKRARPTDYDPRLRVWYQLGAESPDSVQLTEPYMSVTTNDINLGTVKAVHDSNGSLIGVVGADITLHKLSMLTTEFSGYDEPYNIIVSDQNIILSHPNDSFLFKDASVLGYTLPTEDSMTDDLIKIKIDGETKVVFVYHSPTIGWDYYRVVPISVLNEEANNVLLYSVISIFLLVIIIFVTTVKFSKFFSNRIKTISNVMEEVGEGNLSIRVEDRWNDELSVISEGLSNMISRIKDAQYKIKYIDSVTNLINQIKLQEILDKGVNEGYLVQVHISNFLLLTQIYGHEQGISIIREITELLESSLDEDTLLAKVSASSFILVFRKEESKAKISERVNSLRDKLSKVFHIGQSNVFLEYKLGCIYLNNDLPSEEVLVNLNLTTMRDKVKQENIQFYDKDTKNAMLKELTIEKELSHALARNEFYPVFQPIIDINNGEIFGYEILCRWNNRELGLVAPTQFIPIAEKNKTIIEIGEFILKSAIEFGKEYKEHFGKSIMMTVNISVVQLCNGLVLELIEKLLKDNNYDAKYLTIEVTETIFYKADDNLLDIISDIKKLGVSIALDDFGSGYSSINNLLLLPIDFLKIDKQFFWNALVSDKGEAMIKMILRYTENAGLGVIIEGIETEDMKSKVEKFTATYGQGYYYSVPVKNTEIIKK